MLELPELEVAKDRLRLALVGRCVAEVRLARTAALVTKDAPQSLAGTHLASVSRVGRNLCLAADSGIVLGLSPGRNGTLALDGPAAGAPVLVLVADEHRLTFAETGNRPQVRVAVARDPAAVEWLGRAGMDPLSPRFTLDRFRELLRRRNRPVRHVLTDQHALAGLGEAYASEVLFEARISPLAATADLKPEAAIRLHVAMKKVLGSAVVHMKNVPADRLPGVEDRDLRMHRREGEQCPACGAVIRSVRDGTIMTWYCPHCQAGDEVLSDRDRPGP